MRVLLIGDGKELEYLIRSFVTKKHELIVIHDDRDYCKELAREVKAQVVHGDGSNPEILEDAGIELVDVVIANKRNDDENFLICEMAENIYGIKRTLAIVHNPKNIKVFQQLGINNVISFSEMITSFIEQKMNLDDITALYTNEDERISVLEIDIEEEDRAIGKSIKELQLPDKTIIACILRGEYAIIPKEVTRLRIHDRLITYSLPNVEQDLVKSLKG